MSAEHRHLETEELLGLRDGEGTTFARTHVEACEFCRRELERLYEVRARLRALPALEPPRDGWARVASTLRRRRIRSRVSLAGLGFAAAAVLAGALVMRGPAVEPSAPVGDRWVSEARSRDLGPMIHRSQQLETLLESYRPAYRVYDAPTALAVSVLEDRIQLLDGMLEESHAMGADREVLVNLWDDRVETLETLVGLQLVRQEEAWR